MSRSVCAALLITLIGTLLIVSTYSRLSQTTDEWKTLRAGMEWWHGKDYDSDPIHPPITRLATAAPVYLLGVGEHETRRDEYIYRTSLMRAGTLVFYLIACAAVFCWSRSLFGEIAAAWSVALFVTLSTVTAQAGLAVTDMGYTAMLLLTLMASARWLQDASIKNACVLGLMLGLTLGTKFSMLVHWPTAMGLMIAAQWMQHRHKRLVIHHNQLLGVLYGALIAVFTLWVIYQFSFDAFYAGLRRLWQLNARGHAVWLFHDLRDHAVWYFFPVVFFFKTPISFLITSGVATWRGVQERWDAQHWFPLLAGLAIMCSSMFSQLNLGVRHVLPIYPLLAIPAGYALSWLWEHTGWKRGVAAVLIAWQALVFANAYPDHISYFNELGGEHPEHISLDNDFDWGQGYIMLDEALEANHADHVWLCTLQSANHNAGYLLHAGFDGCPRKRPTGWVAVGRAYRLKYTRYSPWLENIFDNYSAVQSVGKTIDLFYIPPK